MHEKRYATWLRLADQQTRDELNQMTEKQIEDAFYKELEFGTAGLRGEMGAGSNRMNVYTVRKVTKGVADYINCCGGGRVALSFDSRKNSREFAITAAEVFASEGIEVFITKELMPSPYLSYLTRRLGAKAGIMITASHNPAIYNGYKVYDKSGCQISEEAASEITRYILKVDAFAIKTGSFGEYLEGGRIKYPPQSLEEDYLGEVLRRAEGRADGLSVVYSPLNGAGYRLVPEALRRLGATVTLTPLQDSPDGGFATCAYPNPEKKEAMSLSLEKAEAINADLVIATDPDADRMGMAIRQGDRYVLLSGNEAGTLFADYLLAKRARNKGRLAADGSRQGAPVIIKTLVTTDLVREVAGEYGGEVREVLTGFKNIGGEIAKLEAEGRGEDFVLGFEESYGYLSGSYVRDKDGVLASVLAAVMTCEYKTKGTPIDRLNEVYAKYGYYSHKTLSFRFEGAAGALKQKMALEGLRKKPFEALCGHRAELTDYTLEGKAFFADVLDYRADRLRMIIRPSGTEPLIKVYLTAAYGKEKNEECIKELSDFIEKAFSDYSLEK